MTQPIPIKNLYYLFLYAWNCFPEGEIIETEAADSPDLHDLFAFVLIGNMRRLLRRGIDRDYLEHTEVDHYPRGKLLLSTSVKTGSLSRRKVTYTHDSLNEDISVNRILKAALRLLGTSDNVCIENAQHCRLLMAQMPKVKSVNLALDLFRSVRLTRNNKHYELPLKIALLLYQTLLPGEGSSRTKFADVLEDEARMSVVFETFLKNFYRCEQSDFAVGSELLRWNATSTNPEHLLHLPSMRTDITLRSAKRTIVTDAKFYRRPLVSHMQGREKIISSHLYQLLSYMRHTQSDGHRKPEGILLYPKNDDHLRLRFELEGLKVTIATVDLSQPWQFVHHELIQLLEAA